MFKSITVLGLARSGIAAAQLALMKGMSVYASDAADNELLRGVAAELRAKGAEVDLGNANVDKIVNTEAIVVSPGIPPHAAPLNDGRLTRRKRISELEFASRFITGKTIAVTGTNGKSTTTAWVGHVLGEAGLKVEVAGNIGNALSNVAMLEEQPDWVVIEASSFQLADIDRFVPSIGVVTNLSPDHLDRYDSIDDYYGDKKRMFKNATIDSIWVLNGDEPDVLKLPGDASGRRLSFRIAAELGVGEHGAFWVERTDELILKVDSLHASLVRSAELKLPGSHNVANALAVSLVAIGTGIPLQSIRDGLKSFGGLPHRMQVVADRNGIVWINDSKATNVASTIVALRSMKRPTVLLLGGKHKGEPYNGLLPHTANVKTVIAFGEAAASIEQDLKDAVDVARVDGSFDDVIKRAARIAVKGDAVLLSPACSSFDMFRNYEERGEEFARLANEKANG
ncbi:MAG TPA: UDP-N-acetylmuramoyl-L-alanine--D-glutamate ligase [Longimicrobiales bacterium]|nr:UDP-N-acetylmuramoyl-L-alanine--D-glutamate ligase [Longimicrobiales bacterium]